MPCRCRALSVRCVIGAHDVDDTGSLCRALLVGGDGGGDAAAGMRARGPFGSGRFCAIPRCVLNRVNQP